MSKDIKIVPNKISIDLPLALWLVSDLKEALAIAEFEKAQTLSGIHGKLRDVFDSCLKECSKRIQRKFNDRLTENLERISVEGQEIDDWVKGVALKDTHENLMADTLHSHSYSTNFVPYHYKRAWQLEELAEDIERLKGLLDTSERFCNRAHESGNPRIIIGFDLNKVLKKYGIPL